MQAQPAGSAKRQINTSPVSGGLHLSFSNDLLKCNSQDLI
jgi:hypothetical protein